MSLSGVGPPDKLRGPSRVAVTSRTTPTVFRLGWRAFRLLALVALAVSISLHAPVLTVAGDSQAGKGKAQVCVPCHGPEGMSTIPTVPSLAGQPEFYLHWQLILFRDNRRRDLQMSPFATNLSDTDMADLAAYYAALKPSPRSPGPGNPEKMAAGQRLVQTHHCMSCHSPEHVGQRYAPNIIGQPHEYLLKQLRGFKSQTRGDLDGTMTMAAQPLSDVDIVNLAEYIAHLAPGP